jgi:hypothetical protein
MYTHPKISTMKKKLKIRIQALLKHGKYGFQGAMSPMGFAMEISERIHKPFNILARVWFDDADTLQQNDSGEHTGYDHLIIGYQDEKEFWLTFWMDKRAGLPIGIAFGTDRKVSISAAYKKERFIKKLSPGEIKEVFHHVFDHPEEIAIRILGYPPYL